MFVFEYEATVLELGAEKPFTTLVVTSEADPRKANIQAIYGAKQWGLNLAKTLNGTSTSLKWQMTERGAESVIWIRRACVAILNDIDIERVSLMTDTSGGAHIGRVWIKQSAVV